MQNYYESFSVCLDRIIRRREITPAQLSRILGHKSRTTLSRVFSGNAGIDSIRKICSEVCGCEELELTEEEKTALTTSVEVDKAGASVLRARDEIRQLLRPAQRKEQTIQIRTGSGQIPLAHMTEKLNNADESEILVLNCAWSAMAGEMYTLLNTIPMERLTVRHYMAINADPARTASMIGTMIGLFGFVNYSCWSISGGDDPTGTLAFMGMNGIAIRTRKGGKTEEYQLIFTGEYSGVMLCADGTYAYWEQYLQELNRDARSVKTTYPHITSAEDYVSFTDTYRRIEENRNIYMYKPDFCLPLIPTRIQLQSCRDNAAQIGLNIPDFMETLEKLAEIQEARFRNFFIQKKAVHMILFPSAIRQFAKTGLQSDHFYLMRPYTVGERIEIMSHLVHQIRTNPYFNIYLLRNEKSFLEMEATCYEGKGVQFTPAHTDYNLSSGHTEAIITNEVFCDLFLQFFRDDLLKNHVYSPAASLFLLESLISELKNETAE
ncbi:MAG: hypothetical protein IJF78_03140 [Clostridia bacterium]|nr:hypothetical protein [Clostridia bacterium]